MSAYRESHVRISLEQVRFASEARGLIAEPCAALETVAINAATANAGLATSLVRGPTVAVLPPAPARHSLVAEALGVRGVETTGTCRVLAVQLGGGVRVDDARHERHAERLERVEHGASSSEVETAVAAEAPVGWEAKAAQEAEAPCACFALFEARGDGSVALVEYGALPPPEPEGDAPARKAY